MALNGTVLFHVLTRQIFKFSFIGNVAPYEKIVFYISPCGITLLSIVLWLPGRCIFS